MKGPACVQARKPWHALDATLAVVGSGALPALAHPPCEHAVVHSPICFCTHCSAVLLPHSLQRSGVPPPFAHAPIVHNSADLALCVTGIGIGRALDCSDTHAFDLGVSLRPCPLHRTAAADGCQDIYMSHLCFFICVIVLTASHDPCRARCRQMPRRRPRSPPTRVMHARDRPDTKTRSYLTYLYYAHCNA